MGQTQSNENKRNFDYDKKIVEGNTIQIYFFTKDFEKAKLEEKLIEKLAKKYGGESGDKGFDINKGRRDMDIVLKSVKKAKELKKQIKKEFPKVRFYAERKPARILILGELYKMPKLSEMENDEKWT